MKHSGILRSEAIGERLQPQPLPAAWRARLGRWQLVGSQGMLTQWAERGRVELTEKWGLLVARVERNGEVEERKLLLPLNDTQAVVVGTGYGQGDTLTIARDAQGELARYSGLSLRRID